jgi:hypothetical protein
VDTANVGARALACLTFYMALREGGALQQTADAPDQGASRIGKLIRKSLRGDHFPNNRNFNMIRHRNFNMTGDPRTAGMTPGPWLPRANAAAGSPASRVRSRERRSRP